MFGTIILSNNTQKYYKHKCLSFFRDKVSQETFSLPLSTETEIKFKFKNQPFPQRSSDNERTLLLPHNIKFSSQKDGVSSSFQWQHFIHVKERKFDGINGIGKSFSVAGNKIFTVEMHPRSGTKTLYDEAGKELIK